MIYYWLVFALTIAALILLRRYTPSGVGEQQLAGEFGRALLAILLVVAFLVYSGVEAWHHVRWTP